MGNPRLFNVLNLLSDFLQLLFHAHDEIADLLIVGFTPHCVHFPVYFLLQKVESSAGRIGSLHYLPGLIQVAV